MGAFGLLATSVTSYLSVAFQRHGSLVKIHSFEDGILAVSALDIQNRSLDLPVVRVLTRVVKQRHLDVFLRRHVVEADADPPQFAAAVGDAQLQPRRRRHQKIP